MQLVFLVIQIILAVAIIGTVLLQKNGGEGVVREFIELILS